jgi:hypothetical protein
MNLSSRVLASAPFLILACSPLPLAAGDPGGCDALLIPEAAITEKDTAAALHYLNILDEKAYETAKRTGGGSLSLPIKGVPFSASGSYSDFNGKKAAAFKENGFAGSAQESYKHLLTVMPPEKVGAWSECKRAYAAGVLSCTLLASDADAATVEVRWRPVGNVTGVVTASTLYGGRVDGAESGQAFAVGKVFEAGASETLIVHRQTRTPLVLSLNLAGALNACIVNVPASAAPPK